MYIQRIELKNYRGHENLAVDFQPRLNVIAGINGAGKTSLLHGLFEALIQAVPQMQGNYFGGTFSDPGSTFVKLLVSDGRTRFEEQFPVDVSVRAEVFGSSMSWRITKTLTGLTADGSNPSPAMHARATSGMDATQSSRIESLPVIAFYRADRAWHVSEVDAIGAATERVSRGHGYEGWNAAGQNAASLQRWLVAKSLERLQLASETGAKFSEIESDELAEVGRALNAGFDIFRSIRYDFPSKKILVDLEKPDQGEIEAVAFEHLSAGQKAVICLFADIARRMCLLNPHLGQHVISETEGIVLIDELDMHLHPEWQRALTRGLMKAFPRVQFIVASHSPQVIGEVPHENVILLTPEGPVNPQGSFGMTSNQVLQELMFAEVRAPSVKSDLDEIDEALTRNQLDVAERKIKELQAKAPDVRELIGKEALLQRKRELGR